MTTQTAPQTKVYRYGPNEYHVGPPTWNVPSASNPTVTYLVTIDERTDLYECGCKDFFYRRRDCKHIRQVQSGAAGNPHLPLSVRPRVAAVAPATVDDLYR